jgi:beta-mannanase
MSTSRLKTRLAGATVLSAALIAVFLLASFTAAPAEAVQPSQLQVGVFFPDPVLPNEQLPDINDLHDFESMVGGQTDVFLWYESISENFYADNFRPMAEEGRIIQIAWEPHNFAKDPNNQPEYRLNTITAGNHDGAIRRWARELRDFGYPVYFRPMCEMNGDWVAWGGNANGNSPQDYIPAWRHIHDIFVQEGASNVMWVWSPNRGGSYADAQNIFNTYYPGDAYVDYVGINGYNWGTMYNTPQWTSTWQDFEEVFKYSYDVAVANTDKPVVICETASTEIGGNAQNGGKAEWIRNAFDIIPSRFPELEMVTWFHINKETDWRITSTQASLNAFREAMLPPDPNPPAVSITSHSQDSTVSGTINITASASDDRGVAKVEFYSGAKLIYTDTAAPYNAYLYTRGLANGPHTLAVKAYDQAGNMSTAAVNVNVQNGKDKSYYFGWYDSATPGMNTWIVIGNPTDQPVGVEVYIGGVAMGGYYIQPHQRVTPKYDGVARGPVKVVSLSGTELMVSQRVTHNNTFSELPATPEEKLSHDHYLAWYDQLSPGMNSNLVIANQGNQTAQVDVYIANKLVGHYALAAGRTILPRYPGIMNGPVRVVSSNGQPLSVSERVIYGGAFNEVKSRAADDLVSEYSFTWYDELSPGMRTWIVVSNQGSRATNVGIYIAGQLVGYYAVPAGGRITPEFPGVMNGPVRVVSSNGEPLIVGQRSTYLGSFEEVPGVSPGELYNDQWFAWYDSQSAGMKTWVLVGNQSQTTARVSVSIAGRVVGHYVIPPGGRVTPTFPGQMNGPVEVKSSVEGQRLVVSQRTTYFNSFDELPGTLLR